MTLWNRGVFPNTQIAFNSNVKHTTVMVFDDGNARIINFINLC